MCVRHVFSCKAAASIATMGSSGSSSASSAVCVQQTLKLSSTQSMSTLKIRSVPTALDEPDFNFDQQLAMVGAPWVMLGDSIVDPSFIRVEPTSYSWPLETAVKDFLAMVKELDAKTIAENSFRASKEWCDREDEVCAVQAKTGMRFCCDTMGYKVYLGWKHWDKSGNRSRPTVSTRLWVWDSRTWKQRSSWWIRWSGTWTWSVKEEVFEVEAPFTPCGKLDHQLTFLKLRIKPEELTVEKTITRNEWMDWRLKDNVPDDIVPPAFLEAYNFEVASSLSDFLDTPIPDDEDPEDAEDVPAESVTKKLKGPPGNELFQP